MNNTQYLLSPIQKEIIDGTVESVKNLVGSGISPTEADIDFAKEKYPHKSGMSEYLESVFLRKYIKTDTNNTEPESIGL